LRSALSNLYLSSLILLVVTDTRPYRCCWTVDKCFLGPWNCLAACRGNTATDRRKTPHQASGSPTLPCSISSLSLVSRKFGKAGISRIMFVLRGVCRLSQTRSSGDQWVQMDCVCGRFIRMCPPNQANSIPRICGGLSTPVLYEAIPCSRCIGGSDASAADSGIWHPVLAKLRWHLEHDGRW